jgi:arylsulfatase A-like enzyme
MTQPNIICISIDSLRADYCSLFDSVGQNTTPFLRSLSSESAVFDSAISPCTWTLPVHTSVFTGLFPPEHGITTGDAVLGEHPTFAELLAQNGYTTSAFYRNSWFDTGDILRGFEYRQRGENDADEDMDTSIKERIADGVHDISPRFESVLTNGYRAQKRLRSALNLYADWRVPKSRTADADREGDRTICESITALEDADEPFCYFVHLNDAHWKYDPPNPFHRSFTDRRMADLVYNHEVWQRRVYHSRSNRFRTAAGLIEPPEREVETFKNLYRGAIEHCDVLIERLVNALKEAGHWDNTVLVVFGDHGDSFGECGIFGHHMTVDDSVIRVPLLIRDPTGRIESGTVSTPVSLVDVYPTILSIAGIDPPDTNAIDLSSETRDYAYTHYDVSDHDAYTNASKWGIDPNDLPPGKQVVIWQSDDDKLIQYPDVDQCDVIGENGERLRNKLDTHIQQLQPVESSKSALDADVTQRLVDMGYLRE